jgi:hypothetical protein
MYFGRNRATHIPGWNVLYFLAGYQPNGKQQKSKHRDPLHGKLVLV